MDWTLGISASRSLGLSQTRILGQNVFIRSFIHSLMLSLNTRDPLLTSSGEGNGNPLQYSCLENSMDRGAWRATVHGVAKSWTRLSMHTQY